ncbi:hypothetical protein IV73_GL000063 [Weissella kandleri]|uniref:Bcr/CflA family efflux transporter n=1 Tax=Weissella kandleri TaxID=1616 RepID=A0A0R2JE28_9LACO|nr:multidrug effflux MFS transporter [Weissella kandleri]KRN75579.1 hypothetical protein IV73_GL000063 [Weissella kandleri]
MVNQNKFNYLQVILLGVLSAFAVFSMDFYLPGLPGLQHDFHTTASLAQLTITASLIGLGVGQLFVGPWSDKIGRRQPLLIGTFIFAVTSFLISISTNISWMIALRFLQGLSGSVGIVLSLAIITDSFNGPSLTRQIAINQAINGIFPIIAPVLGGMVVALSNWQMTFVILMTIGLLLFVAVFFGLPETKQKSPQVQSVDFEQPSSLGASLKLQGREYLKLAHKKNFMTYLWVQTFMMAALFAYISGSSFVLENIFHLNVTLFGLVYALNGVGMTVMTALAGSLAPKYGERRVLGWFIIYGLLGGTILLTTTLMGPRLGGVLLAFFMITSAVGGVQGMATSLAMQGQQAHSGSASALLGTSRYAIGGLMSPLVGMFGTQTILPLASLILGVQLLAGGCFWRSQENQ